MGSLITNYDTSNMECSNRLGSLITNYARCIYEIKFRIATAKATLNIKDIFTSKLDLNLRKNIVMCCICSLALIGTETWTFRKVDQKYRGSFEMWYGRRIEKISWTDRLRSEEVLHIFKAERNILHTMKRRKVNWIGQILRRNWLLEHVIEVNIEGKMEVTGRRGRRGKEVWNVLKKGIGYWKLEEALDRILWRTRFGRRYGAVVRQTTE